MKRIIILEIEADDNRTLIGISNTITDVINSTDLTIKMMGNYPNKLAARESTILSEK